MIDRFDVMKMAHANIAALCRTGSNVEAMISAARVQIEKWRRGQLCS